MGSRPLNGGSVLPFLDVSWHGEVSPWDLLRTVHFLPDRPVLGGEGEAGIQIAPIFVQAQNSLDPALFRNVAAARVMARDDLWWTSVSADQTAPDLPQRTPVDSAANLQPASSDIARQDHSTLMARMEETLESFIEDIAKLWYRG
jgi:hypothetical protein